MDRENDAMPMKSTNFMLAALSYIRLLNLCWVQSRRRLNNLWDLPFPSCVHVTWGRENEGNGGPAHKNRFSSGVTQPQPQKRDRTTIRQKQRALPIIGFLCTPTVYNQVCNQVCNQCILVRFTILVDCGGTGLGHGSMQRHARGIYAKAPLAIWKSVASHRQTDFGKRTDTADGILWMRSECLWEDSATPRCARETSVRKQPPL